MKQFGERETVSFLIRGCKARIAPSRDAPFLPSAKAGGFLGLDGDSQPAPTSSSAAPWSCSRNSAIPRCR